MASNEIAEQQNFKNILFLAICFMVLFSSFYAGQNLMSQVYKQMGFGPLGKICFFTIMGTFAVFAVIAPHFCKHMSAIKVMKLATIPYIAFISAGVLATTCAKYEVEGGFCNTGILFVLNVCSAASLGAGGAFLWTAQITYLSACATDRTRGLLTGTFNSILQTAQIVSGILVAVVLGFTDQFTFYVILLIIIFIAVVMFNFIHEAVEYADKKVKRKKSTIYGLENENLNQYMAKFIVILYDQRYKFLLKNACFVGVGSAFIPTFLGQAVAIALDTDDSNLVNFSTGLVFIILALGEILGAMGSGKYADKAEDKISLLSPSMMIYEVALIITLIGCITKSFAIVIASAFFWGAGEAAIGTVAWVIIGDKFGAKNELFGAFRLVSNMSGAIVVVATIILPKPLMIVALVAGIFIVAHSLYLKDLKNTVFDDDKSDIEQSLMMEMTVREGSMVGGGSMMAGGASMMAGGSMIGDRSMLNKSGIRLEPTAIRHESIMRGVSFKM